MFNAHSINGGPVLRSNCKNSLFHFFILSNAQSWLVYMQMPVLLIPAKELLMEK